MTIQLQTGTVKSRHEAVDIRWGLYARQPDCERFLLFVNGRSEWIEKYHDLPEALDLPDDCGFLTLDHRGQGASGGERGTVKSYDHYVDDLVDVVTEVIGDKPYVALSHSMGCLILARAVLTQKLTPHSMVLSSPFFGLPRQPVPPGFANGLAKFLYAIGLGSRRLGVADSEVGRFEKNRLTQDRARFEAMQQCPYPVPTATVQWVAESVRSFETIFQPAPLKQLDTPTLVMMGTEETVVDRFGGERWVQQAKEYAVASIQYREFVGARHELFTESDPYRGPAIEASRAWFSAFLDQGNASQR